VWLRRAIYWTALLALVVVWFTMASADGMQACRAAAPPPPLDEFATNGISYLPPGYECSYISGRNTVEPLDAAGWVDWGLSIGILVLLLSGAMSFVIRLGLTVSDRRTPSSEH
jgi:hypothetical protein